MMIVVVVVEYSCCAECITSIPYVGCASPWIQTNEASILVVETFLLYHLYCKRMMMSRRKIRKRRSPPFDRNSPTRAKQSSNNAVHKMPVAILSIVVSPIHDDDVLLRHIRTAERCID